MNRVWIRLSLRAGEWFEPVEIADAEELRNQLTAQGRRGFHRTSNHGLTDDLSYVTDDKPIDALTQADIDWAADPHTLNFRHLTVR